MILAQIHVVSHSFPAITKVLQTGPSWIGQEKGHGHPLQNRADAATKQHVFPAGPPLPTRNVGV